MASVKLIKFLGEAPKVSSELLPDGAAQTAFNVKLYSGDLLPYRTPKVVDNTAKPVDGTTDYNQLDRPAVMRKRPMANGNAAVDSNASAGAETGVEYLDIPAFLRRQAD